MRALNISTLTQALANKFRKMSDTPHPSLPPKLDARRIIEIDGTLNFRDLGGYLAADGRSVKWRKVFRSAQLDRLSPQGINALSELKVSTVIDLRFTEETQRYPTIQAALPAARFFAWQDELKKPASGIANTPKSDGMRRSWRDSLDSNDPEVVREAMRVNYPTKLYSHRGIYRRMLLCLASSDTPLLFHCAAGKDRTGVAAALILALLGVDEVQIVDDYLLTQPLIEGRMANWLAAGANVEDQYEDFQKKLAAQPSEMLEPVFAADRNYITTLLEYVASTYGGFQRYAAEQLGLSDAELAAVRDNLLE